MHKIFSKSKKDKGTRPASATVSTPSSSPSITSTPPPTSSSSSQSYTSRSLPPSPSTPSPSPSQSPSMTLPTSASPSLRSPSSPSLQSPNFTPPPGQYQQPQLYRNSSFRLAPVPQLPPAFSRVASSTTLPRVPSSTPSPPPNAGHVHHESHSASFNRPQSAMQPQPQHPLSRSSPSSAHQRPQTTYLPSNSPRQTMQLAPVPGLPSPQVSPRTSRATTQVPLPSRESSTENSTPPPPTNLQPAEEETKTVFLVLGSILIPLLLWHGLKRLQPLVQSAGGLFEGLTYTVGLLFSALWWILSYALILTQVVLGVLLLVHPIQVWYKKEKDVHPYWVTAWQARQVFLIFLYLYSFAPLVSYFEWTAFRGLLLTARFPQIHTLVFNLLSSSHITIERDVYYFLEKSLLYVAVGGLGLDLLFCGLEYLFQ
eukprot:TRINITY_DN1461_c0_g9_i1.p1 TRINITY_DN1461_c0_g9~~TRINITY_DN1461_c0_g9_i1.p1  ORF type:complete len:426 (+),score=64.81 TRINITY_DN1461_c0_g9_i1:45-1322(+)